MCEKYSILNEKIFREICFLSIKYMQLCTVSVNNFVFEPVKKVSLLWIFYFFIYLFCE